MEATNASSEETNTGPFDLCSLWSIKKKRTIRNKVTRNSESHIKTKDEGYRDNDEKDETIPPVTNKMIGLKLKNVEERKTFCNECLENFKSETEYVTHFRLMRHSTKAFICPHCGQDFPRRYQLTKHSNKVHGVRIIPSRRKTTTAIYDCVYCGGRFRGTYEYERHAFKAHPGKKLFHCTKCSEGFVSKSNMNRHMRELHDAGDLNCELCGQCFIRTDLYGRHVVRCKKRKEQQEMNIMKGVMPRYCEHCDVTFYSKYRSFDTHMRSHKIYVKCTMCPERFHRFNHPERLTEHMRKRHSIQLNIQALLKTISEAEALMEAKKEGNIQTGKSEPRENPARNSKPSFLKSE